jgi:hypothetical protein
MTALLLLLAMLPTPTVQTGTAKFYSPHVMERVYRVRVAQGMVPAGWSGALVATPHCYNIGRILRVSYRNPNTGHWSDPIRSLDIDCARPRDLGRQVAEGLVVEASWNTAAATGWAYEGRTRAIVDWEANR